MVISAVSAVSFKGNRKINYEDTKRTVYSPNYSSSLKTVPLAVLLALSPLNVNSYNNGLANITDNTEQVRPKNKVLDRYEFKDATYTGEKCQILFVSTDGDDSNTEKVDLVFAKSAKFNTIINKNGLRVKVPAIKTVYNMLTVDTLKTVNINTTMPDGTIGKYKKYYVSGPGIYRIVEGNLEGTEKFSDTINKQPSISIEVRPELFETLSKFMGDEVNRKTESVFNDSLF